MNLNSLSSEIELESTLDRLCGDEVLLLEILDLFLEDFYAEQPLLLNRVDTNDYAGLASKAHYFKGIAQNIGLVNFLSQIIQLEQAAKLHDSAACQQAIDLLSRTTRHISDLRTGVKAA